jgi:hypothetical protein
MSTPFLKKIYQLIFMNKNPRFRRGLVTFEQAYIRE